MLKTIETIKTIKIEPMGMHLNPRDLSLHGGFLIKSDEKDPKFEVRIICPKETCNFISMLGIETPYSFSVEPCSKIFGRPVKMELLKGEKFLIGTNQVATIPLLIIRVADMPKNRTLFLHVSAPKLLILREELIAN